MVGVFHCCRCGVGWGLVALFALAGCAKVRSDTTEAAPVATAQPAPDAVALSFEPAPEQRVRLGELENALGRLDGRLPQAPLLEPDNAPLLVYLAATSASPTVQAAALFGMAEAFSPHGKARPRPDEDYLTTVRHRLQAPHPEVVGGALEAAHTALSGKTASAELTATLVAMATDKPTDVILFEVIRALSALSADNRTQTVTQVFRDALHDSRPAHVLALSLHALLRATRTVKRDDKLTSTLEELAQHADPAVRGRSIELLGALSPHDPQLHKSLKAALNDPHPYVRAEACEAAARLRHLSLIHPLMRLLHDQERAEYTLSGWSRLSGAPGTLQLRAGNRSEVRHAALQALRSLSAGELRLVRSDETEPQARLDDNISRALAWYEQRKSSLPL